MASQRSEIWRSDPLSYILIKKLFVGLVISLPFSNIFNLIQKSLKTFKKTFHLVKNSFVLEKIIVSILWNSTFWPHSSHWQRITPIQRYSSDLCIGKRPFQSNSFSLKSRLKVFIKYIYIFIIFRWDGASNLAVTPTPPWKFYNVCWYGAVRLELFTNEGVKFDAKVFKNSFNQSAVVISVERN